MFALLRVHMQMENHYSFAHKGAAYKEIHIYVIFQQRGNRFSDSRYRSGRWPRYLGCHQPVGRLRQRQPWRKILGHETADGWWRRDTDRHDSGAVAFWTFWLNYGILKLKGNRIRHNPKKPMKINRSCGL